MITTLVWPIPTARATQIAFSARKISTEIKYLAAAETPSFSAKSDGPLLSFYDELYVQLLDQEPVNVQAASIEENREVRALCQSPAPWPLASLAQAPPPASPTLSYPFRTPQPDTQVVVIDTWVDVSHPDFEGRAHRGPAFANGTSQAHGTHVSGLIGSRTWGVNKNATIVSVQVLNDQGTGTWATILAGLEWVTKNLRPSIINMSIGGPQSRIVDHVVDLVVRHGWKVVVAAGNEAQDACNTSPAGAGDALAIGAFDRNLKWASFSNYGRCVNMLAPGVDVESTFPGGKTGFASGTSMASPIVAGLWSLVPAMPAQQFLALFGDTCRIQGVPPLTSNVMASCYKAGLCNEKCTQTAQVMPQHCWAMQCSLCT